MSGTSYYSAPIDMAGFRCLRVEANLPDDPAGSAPTICVQVEGSDDFDSERKDWTWEGPAMNLNPVTSAMGDHASRRRLARIRVDVPFGIHPKDLKIRLTRLD